MAINEEAAEDTEPIGETHKDGLHYRRQARAKLQSIGEVKHEQCSKKRSGKALGGFNETEGHKGWGMMR